MLTVSNLRFRIGDMRILNGINFSVQAGDKLGIIGPNGSGKTTLFNCISGFNMPTTGKIYFRGHDITRISPSKRASYGIGRVFQNFGIFREMTVMENIQIALEATGQAVLFPWSKTNKNNKEKVLEFLCSVGLEERAKEKAGSLSGGQMRLLEITRAIAFGAELFLLDEPTAGVSPKMKKQIEHSLQKLQELEKTVLIIEHDINFIQQLCDRIIVLDMGRVMLDGAADEVRCDPRLQEIYFGANGQNGHVVEEFPQKSMSAL
jgi:branched-chain amino acid transport system ATP-binding protein